MSAYYNELEPFAASWLGNLMEARCIAAGRIDTQSIRDVKAADLRGVIQAHFFAGIGGWSHALRLAGWPDDRPVWTGSCPCQPFSSAGEKRGFNDERHLWPTWFNLIRQQLPPVCFGEQVASPDGLRWLDAVQADLEGCGYAFGASVLPASCVGAPHGRHRIYFVAVSNQQRCQGVRLQSQQGDDDPQVGRRGPAGHADQLLGQLADPQGSGQPAWRAARPRGRDAVQPHRHGEAGGVPDAPGGRRSQGHLPGGAPREDGAGSADPSRLGQPAGGGRGESRCDSASSAAADGEGEATERGNASPVDGFWADADWLYHRDGRWRPVEPGTFPLAHGVPRRVGPGGALETQPRVGRLRGYGNAIVPQVAALFIRAFLDTEGVTHGQV